MKIGRSLSRMEKAVPLIGRGLPTGGKRSGNATCNSLNSGIRASVVFAPLVSKTFCSSYAILIIMILATTYFSMISAQNFTIQSTSFECYGNLICLGGAHVSTEDEANGIYVGRLSLLKNQSTNNYGIVYYNESVKLLDKTTGQSASFKTSFVVNTIHGFFNGSKDADGITFVMSADNEAGAGGGGSFGIFSVDGTTNFKSIVVEFDTFRNSGGPEYDINNNHVSFDFSNITTTFAADAGNVNVDMGAENLTLYAWVDYSSQTRQLEVRVSNNNSRPIWPLLNCTVNLDEVVAEYMWVGFSTGVGPYPQSYYIGNWTFESYGISPPDSKGAGKGAGIKLPIIVGLCVAIPLFLTVCMLITVFMQKSSRKWLLGELRGWLAGEKDEMNVLEGMPERYSYRQLRVATKAFSAELKLGQGGFGSVYRGVLPSSRLPVAVKVIKGDSTQGERDFMAEISIISQLRHRNLIQLLGWCKDAYKEKYLLVYEYMPNGSLDKALFGPVAREKACLSWEQRFNIVSDTAAALEYLHQGWKQQVIHRDIKSSNIMLDKEWNAKLGDFGLARLVDHHREGRTTVVAGTLGYLAPEVVANGKFTEKTDVFAFGVVVLEVACGRKALSFAVPESEMVLVDWVRQNLSEGNLMSTVDKRLKDYDPKQMQMLLIVGLLCSHPDPVARPSMRHVAQVLSGEAPVPLIPDSEPALVFRSVCRSLLINFPATVSLQLGTNSLQLGEPQDFDR